MRTDTRNSEIGKGIQVRADGECGAVKARSHTKFDNICIIGLGYVGLTLGAVMAKVGYTVFGVEKSLEVRNNINNGRAHFAESGLNAVISECVEKAKLFCNNVLPDPGDVSTYIITVGTPLTPDGAANLKAIEEVLYGVAANLRDGDLVVLRSTVKVGTTRAIAKKILDQSQKDYDLAFCPERTLEGKALRELTELPQIIGTTTERAKLAASRIFSPLTDELVHLPSFEAAELAKLINNTYRDLLFAFSNEVAEISEAVGVSATEVIAAACHKYPRTAIAKPGLVGGPCLEKDTHILVESLRDFGYEPRLAANARRLNERLPLSTMGRIDRYLRAEAIGDLRGHKVSILGLAFKGRPETDDVRGTMAKHVLEAARARWPQATFCAFDPVVPERKFLEFEVEHCSTLEAAFTDATLVIIQNNHRAFENMDLQALATLMNVPALIYDYWGLFDRRATVTPTGVRYAGLGDFAIER